MKRRSFLKVSTASLAAAALLPATALAGEDDKKTFKIRTSLKLGMVKTKGSLNDKFQLVKDLGYDGIEVDGPGPSTKDLIAARDKTGLPIHGVVNNKHWKVKLSDPKQSTRDEARKYLEAALEMAKEIGATSVLLVPGKVEKGTSFEECWKRSIPEIKKAIPVAQKTGIKIALENVWNNFLKTPEETLKYINEIDSDMVAAYFDIGNSQRYTEKTARWIPILGDKIMKLDIKGYSLEKGKKNPGKGFGVKIGEGTVDWADCVKELKKINFNGWATAEVPGGGKERLAEIKKNMDKVLSGS